MLFQVLASGSKGNLTYIKTDQTSVLIDAGISIKEIVNRSDINLQEIEAIFVTHEHGDHVRYLESIARKTNATIYINEDSFKEIYPKYIKNIDGLTLTYNGVLRDYGLFKI